jgi:FkbM family methyltransferase
MTDRDPAQFGALAPGAFDRMVIAMTARLPDNWLGLRLAILLRRAVTMRLAYPDGALDVERWGMRLRLHPRDNGCEKNLLFTPQMYEAVELKALADDIARMRDRGRPRGRPQGRPYVFIDIGANVGLFSLFVAALAGADARILAIEPEPGNLRRLNFNIHANPYAPVTVLPLALSDAPGDVAIALDRRDRGGSRMIKLMPAQAATETLRVSSQALLAVLAAEHIDVIDALKIDVEGAEDVILAPFFGAAPPALWPRLIVIEDSRAGWNIDLLSILSARGYTMATRSKQNLILRRDIVAATETASGCDAVRMAKP